MAARRTTNPSISDAMSDGTDAEPVVLAPAMLIAAAMDAKGNKKLYTVVAMWLEVQASGRTVDVAEIARQCRVSPRRALRTIERFHERLLKATKISGVTPDELVAMPERFSEADIAKARQELRGRDRLHSAGDDDEDGD